MRVLVVPPEVAEHAALQAWMRGREVQLESQASCAEADLTLQREPCDLVVCDATRVPAIDLLRTVRARGGRVPFILLTPGSADEIMHRARTLGGGLCVPTRSGVQAFAEAAARALAPPGAAPSRVSAGPELAPAMLWRTGPDGAFDRFSQAWLSFTGRSLAQERASGWIAGLHPDDLDRWLDEFGAALGAGRSFEIDVRLRRKEGEHRWLRFSGVPQSAADRSFAGFLGASFDVSDLVSAQADLASEIGRLKSANADLEQFASAAAHDLDEPLRTLENALGPLHAEASAADLDEVRSSARRMRALVRDLLACTLVGVSDSRLEPVDLSTPLDWALENLESRVQRSGAQVTRDALPVVFCDPVQLARAFQNLIANALRYRGKDSPQVHISTESTGPEVVISVRDNGIGIDPEHHERIFEPFKRVYTKSVEDPDSDIETGSGLGLALCKRVAERHGGRIWVQSEPGKGSTFYLSLKS